MIFRLAKSGLKKAGLASTNVVLIVFSFFSPARVLRVLERAPTVCRLAPHSGGISLFQGTYRNTRSFTSQVKYHSLASTLRLQSHRFAKNGSLDNDSPQLWRRSMFLTICTTGGKGDMRKISQKSFVSDGNRRFGTSYAIIKVT